MARDDDDLDFDDLDATYQMFRRRTPAFGLVLPVIVLVLVVAVVSGLVFGGVIQGHEGRTAGEDSSTTVPTVQIVP
jgi:hypothetical protein